MDSQSAEEALFELLAFWFGTPHIGKRRIDVRRCWDLWFAKGERQTDVDRRLQKFAGLFPFFSVPDGPLLDPRRTAGASGWQACATYRLDSDSWDEVKYSAIIQEHETFLQGLSWPDIQLARVGLMVLCDQVTRNLARGRAGAYAGDRLALHHATVLLQGDAGGIELPFRAAACLVLIHSEDPGIFHRAASLVEEITSLPELTADVAAGLRGIYQNHAARMHAFGRVPERNPALGRVEQASERAFRRAVMAT